MLCKDCKKREIDYIRSKRCCTICLDKRIKSQQRYAKNHPEKVKEIHDNAVAKKPNYYKKIKEEYLKTHKDELKLKAKEYRNKNKEKVRKSKQRCWYARHDYYLNKAKEWRQNNLEQSNEIIRRSTLKRRAAKLSNGGSFTQDEWESLLDRYEHKCLSCGRDDVKLEVDHVIPLSKGGRNDISNLQPLCRSCNASKNNAIIDYR